MYLEHKRGADGGIERAYAVDDSVCRVKLGQHLRVRRQELLVLPLTPLRAQVEHALNGRREGDAFAVLIHLRRSSFQMMHAA